MAASAAMGQDTHLAQFVRSTVGKEVTVFVDGHMENTFAGKMGYRDAVSSWSSVCVNIRKPVAEGQYCMMTKRSAKEVGGNLAKAARIVAKYFDGAQTPEQAAGLQIAVWEAVEYGGAQAPAIGGPLYFRADPMTMYYAENYYAEANDEAAGDADAAVLSIEKMASGQDQMMPLGEKVIPKRPSDPVSGGL